MLKSPGGGSRLSPLCAVEVGGLTALAGFASPRKSMLGLTHLRGTGFFSFTPLSIKVYRVAAPVGSKNAGSSTLCEGDPCVFSWSPVCVIYPQLLSAFYC